MIDKLAKHSIVINPEDKILDLGCGYNQLVAYLIKKGYNATGIDYKKDLMGWPLSEITPKSFFVADINKLPFKDESFQFVISSWILDYIGGTWSTILMENLLRETYRVLDKKGVYFFRDFDNLMDFKIAKQIGFEKIDKDFLRKP